jgi:murein L,D-transpeptidase YafK
MRADGGGSARTPRRALLAALGLAWLAVPGAHAGAFDTADRVVVKKSERTLSLMRDGKVLRTFKVALGLSPLGHKLREGDFRTPEGSYSLVERNADSDFFLSIRISYPSAADSFRARREGHAPGGAIMIHGQPNLPTHSPEYYRRTDWTNGCIAVSNSDMVDIWLMTGRNTPIDIYP